MQKQIELTNKTVLVVGLPEESDRFKMFPDIGSQPYLSYFIGVETYRDYVDTGFELVGIHPELTEQECKRVVERLFFAEAKPHPYYVNYTDEAYYCDTAKEAFDTLMQKLECYTVNPYDEPIEEEYDIEHLFYHHRQQWQEAEQSTFKKFAVLIKNKS